MQRIAPIIAAAAVALSVRPAAAQTPVAAAGGRILVMPFDNPRHQGQIFWLGEAASVLVTDNLAATGANPITRPERQQAFDRLQVPPAAALTTATVIRLGQIVGADRIIVGELQLDGETLVVRARSIALEPGRLQVEASERGALADLYATFERLSRTLAVPPSGSRAVASHAARPPVAAFENYIKGLLAETPDTSIGYLKSALKLDPSFDRARLALWDAYTDQDDFAEALASVGPVPQSSPYARRARFLGALSELDLHKYDEAFAHFKALTDERTDAPALNNIGVVQLRRPATASIDKPATFFQKAAEADPDDSDYVFNLGYASWLAHDAQASIYWLREAVRRKPTDGAAHYVLGTALAAAGSGAEAAREKELARRLSSEYAQWDKRPPTDPVPRGLERVKVDVELPHTRELQSRLTTTERRDQQELAQFYLNSARRLYERENDREAAAELNRALYLSPYLAEAHLLLGRIHLRGGSIKEAIDAFKIALWSAETAEAHAALGEAYRQDKDLDAARAEADRALAMDPSSAEARSLLARLNAR
ncbi:MAG TPA: tetratricopeptide repeat protein [Vicinamibacterales bacterium]